MKTIKTITSTQVIKEFKTVIVPGVLDISFNKAMKDTPSIIQVGSLFVQYVDSLEAKCMINSKTAQDLELKFVKILQDTQK